MRLAPVLVALAAVAHAAPVAPANNNDKRQVFTISIPNPFAPQSSTVVPPPVVTTTPPPVVTTTTTPPAVTTTTPPAVTTTSHAPSNEPSSSSIAPPSVVPPSSSSTTTTTSATPTTTSAAPSSTTSTTSSEVSSSAEPSSSQPPTQVTVTEHGSSAVESSHSATAAPSNSKKESLSTGAIAGIAVGGGLALIAIITAIVLFARRRRHDDDDAIRWPELNRHGDSSTMAALPAHRTGHHGIDTGPADRRMSLGSDLDGPAYMQDDHTPVSALNGSSFGSPAGLHDYNEKASYFDPAATTSHNSEGYNSGPIGLAPGEVYHPSSHSAGSYGEHDDYTSYPPAVRPQPSPVHGVADYDWEQAQSQDPYGGYVGATRQESPPSGMTGVGSYPNRY